MCMLEEMPTSPIGKEARPIRGVGDEGREAGISKVSEAPAEWEASFFVVLVIAVLRGAR